MADGQLPQLDPGDDRTASEAAEAFCVGAAREFLRGSGAARGGPGDRTEPRDGGSAAVADADLARSAAGALRRLAVLGCDDLLDGYLSPDPTSGIAPSYVVLRYEVGNTEPVVTETHHSPVTALAALDEDLDGADAQELTVVGATGTSWVPVRRVGGLLEFAGLPFVEMAGPAAVVDRAVRCWEGILSSWARRHDVAGAERLPGGEKGATAGLAADPAVLADAVAAAVRAELGPVVDAMAGVAGRLDEVVRRLGDLVDATAPLADHDSRWLEPQSSSAAGPRRRWAAPAHRRS
ncbi:MAG: hypothetical protein WKF93_10575 [Acidimicrobiales bacterium]